MKLIVKISEGSVRDSLSLLDRALITQKIEQKELANMKITICGGDAVSHAYYFRENLKNKLFSKDDADYVLMTNRVSNIQDQVR